MKSFFLLSFLSYVFSGVTQIVIFKRVEAAEITYEKFNIDKEGTVVVPAFEVSDQITVQEYKYYLNSIRFDSTQSFYESQLPFKAALNPIEVKDYLGNYSFQNAPIAGVSWEQAINFTKWLNLMENDGQQKFVYTLPLMTEWFVAVQQIKSFDKSNYSDWTLNNYDESLTQIQNKTAPNYIYFASQDDPLSMKRKVYLGDSFKQNYADSINLRNWYHYQNKGYKEVSFRVVRKLITNEKYASKLVRKPLNNDLKSVTMNGSVINFHTNEGLFNGKYTSYYPKSKQMKHKGCFIKNQRKGIWEFYNSAGELQEKRLYYNSLNYTVLNASITNDHFIESKTDVFLKRIERDSAGLIPYDFVYEEDVVSSKRIWRRLLLSENPVLQENMALLLVLIKDAFIKDDSIGYSKTNDEFKTTLTNTASLSLFTTEPKIIGFEIKEDHFTDRNRGIADIRIIGLAPIIENNKGESNKLCWLYYPQLRYVLAKAIINVKGFMHLEDLFYYRNFKSEVIKESNFNEKEMTGRSLEKEIYLIEYQNETIK